VQLVELVVPPFEKVPMGQALALRTVPFATSSALHPGMTSVIVRRGKRSADENQMMSTQVRTTCILC
jgi:hypothetical protein